MVGLFSDDASIEPGAVVLRWSDIHLSRDWMCAMGLFITRPERQAVPDTPEMLFRSLRPTDGRVQHLWSHQADLLRNYLAVADKSDIALELPTGGGKTLVGLLLAEFRRRTQCHPVAYLCPNNQLAQQATAKARDYGIQAVTLVGRAAEYDQQDLLAFNRGNAIAVTNYHAVFNSNPQIRASTLVLDDAHAGEEPAASVWSLTAQRDGGALYSALLANVIDGLPQSFGEQLRDPDLDPTRRYQTELVPPAFVIDRAHLLREVLSEHATAGSAFFVRDEIAGSLEHCLVYVCWREILIRPLIPPTFAHAAFSDASQRIYMSATLGAGGELERAFGVPKIHRLPVPPGWDEHGSGRRFFMFPGAAADTEAVVAFTRQAIERSGRVLVLASSGAELQRFENHYLPARIVRVRAPEFERDAESFTVRDQAALLLANRYDGIDLPDDRCRLIVLSGLPAGTHLQERFLHETVQARSVLAERIRTRLVQGVGRCTRNPGDYAAVIVLGDRLVSFLSREENTRAMRRELQAEIAFGLDNSEVRDADLGRLLESFLTRDNDWQEAERDIQARVADAVLGAPTSASALQNSAEREVQAWQSVWRGQLREAVRCAQEALDRMEGGSELRTYRCLWLYLAASWALELANQSGEQEDVTLFDTLHREFSACASGISWFPPLDPQLPRLARTGQYDQRALSAVDVLQAMGIRGTRFERRLAEVESQISKDEATQFELGLAGLGAMLGFEAVRPRQTADPDSAWRSGDELWLLFEAKTEELPQNPVSATEVRQASSHHDWALNVLGWSEPQTSMTVVVTRKQVVDPTVAAISGELRMVFPDVIRDIARRTFLVHREVRARARGLSEEELAAAFSQAFQRNGLSSTALLGSLGQRRIANG